MSYVTIGQRKDSPALTPRQIEILSIFYAEDFQSVPLNKRARQLLWDSFKSDRKLPQGEIARRCPALVAEIEKSLRTGKLVQSAIFSECVYAQGLANVLLLNDFYVWGVGQNQLTEEEQRVVKSLALTPRYIYKSRVNSLVLVQAGGPGGVDCVILEAGGKKFWTVEFKESLAKTSEADLPKYDETGLLVKTKEFMKKHPQFEPMLDEQIEQKLNFFEVQGSNIKNFSAQSIAIAVNENYGARKFADVVCVEDSQGLLAMVPANDLTRWAEVEGEIRPAGRNKFAVFTPKALGAFIADGGGQIDGQTVRFPIEKMKSAAQRGGDGKVNRWKLNSLFFVYATDATLDGSDVIFRLQDVRQLKPTISAHMDFKKLNIDVILDFYRRELNG